MAGSGSAFSLSPQDLNKQNLSYTVAAHLGDEEIEAQEGLWRGFLGSPCRAAHSLAVVSLRFPSVVRSAGSFAYFFGFQAWSLVQVS